MSTREDRAEDARDWARELMYGTDEHPSDRYGMCTHCGAVEVLLNSVTGHRDLSHMGESSRYPTGHGCEVCA